MDGRSKLVGFGTGRWVNLVPAKRFLWGETIPSESRHATLIRLSVGFLYSDRDKIP
jgi:hypothetical protein